MDVIVWFVIVFGSHDVVVSIDGCDWFFLILGCDGGGFGVSGGELLLFVFATCFGNDFFREVALLGILIDAVEVMVLVEFSAAGLSAENVWFWVRVMLLVFEDVVCDFVVHTDLVAEI